MNDNKPLYPQTAGTFKHKHDEDQNVIYIAVSVIYMHEKHVVVKIDRQILPSDLEVPVDPDQSACFEINTEKTNRDLIIPMVMLLTEKSELTGMMIAPRQETKDPKDSVTPYDMLTVTEEESLSFHVVDLTDQCRKFMPVVIFIDELLKHYTGLDEPIKQLGNATKHLQEAIPSLAPIEGIVIQAVSDHYFTHLADEAENKIIEQSKVTADEPHDNRHMAAWFPAD